MANTVGISIKLQDASGLIGSPANAVGLALRSALVGSLTITNIVDAAGAPVGPWVLSGGSNGYQAAPGNASSGGGQLWYSLSNVGADAGKAIVFFF